MAHAIALARMHGHRLAGTVRVTLVAGCAAALIAAGGFLPGLAL